MPKQPAFYVGFFLLGIGVITWLLILSFHNYDSSIVIFTLFLILVGGTLTVKFKNPEGNCVVDQNHEA